MIYSENLGSVRYSNRPVHCCFNIYKRNKNGLLKKPNYELKEILLKTVIRSKYRNDKIPDSYDFSICSFGQIAILGERENQWCNQTYVKIYTTKFKKQIRDIILNTDWKELYGMTGTPSLSNWQIQKYLKEQIPELTYTHETIYNPFFDY